MCVWRGWHTRLMCVCVSLSLSLSPLCVCGTCVYVCVHASTIIIYCHVDLFFPICVIITDEALLVPSLINVLSPYHSGIKSRMQKSEQAQAVQHPSNQQSQVY